MSIAEKLNKAKGRRITDELDPQKVANRVNAASIHLRRLSDISTKLDPEDYESIRKSLMPIVETFSSQYSKKSAKEKVSA